MGEQLVIRGVPTSLARDGWWFMDDADTGPAPSLSRSDDAQTRRLPPKALVALAVLILLADGLFWDADFGISIALYALALSSCMIALKPGGVTGKQATSAMAFSVLSNLPVIEQVQTLSVLFSGAGVVVILVWIALGPDTQPGQAVRLFLRASFVGPTYLPRDAVSDFRHTATGLNATAVIRAAALPVTIGTVFLFLFAYANPLLENALSRITLIEVFTPEQMTRFTFWVVAACFLWPYLNTQGGWRRTAQSKTRVPRRPSMLINESSIRTSLTLFNAMFAVQTASDLGILTGGVALPEGMTYAEYAHRGAYPLLVTALLSGLFAIVTQRHVSGNKVLRGLMYLWLGQNLILVVTAAVRLGLYVDAYSLTLLRVAAFIWMGLIFLGLVLILVQMTRKYSVGWLLESNAIAVGTTLYLCCFINFAYLITNYNMTHTPPEALDLAYLCRLGEQVIPAMMEYGQINDDVACGRGRLPTLRFAPIEDWQEWGFRRYRLQRYLETYHDL